MDSIGVYKVLGSKEKSLKAFFSAGYYGRVITEEQAAEHSYQNYREQVSPAAVFLIFHKMIADLCIHIYYSLIQLLLA